MDDADVRPSPEDLLAEATPALRDAARQFSRDFFVATRSDPDVAAFHDRLDNDELAHLTVQHARHLEILMDPATTDDEILARARRGGHVHAMVGIDTAHYATALGQYRRTAVEALVDWRTRADRVTVWAAINRRVFLDLRGHLTGHHETTSELPKVAVALSEVAAQAPTVADLARGVLSTIVTLPGIAVAYFGRPDSEGIVRFEARAGDASDSFLSTSPPLLTWPRNHEHDDIPSTGPATRAWHSGAIERSDSYQTDPTTRPWHAVGRQHGIRSSVAIPITDANNQPRAMITAYAKYPGFFAEPSRMLLFQQLRQLMEQALVRLESRQGLAANTSTFDARARHRSALDRGDVTLLYQPIVDLRSGAVVKFEALARIPDGDRLISPAEFLPSFGGRELWRLFEIGLDQAFGDLRCWEDNGVRTAVSINLPSTLALTAGHGTVVTTALQRHGIEPHRLTLEVLESGVIELEGTGYSRVLGEIQESGVRLAEDDLGIAYSSLLRLRYLRFDEVKIAQELVRSSGGDARETWGFIQPLTNLVHQLGPHVTVEGLESPGLIEAAVFLGADWGQGYAFARPMTAAEVPGWLRQFQWSVDDARPATDLGALATHLAWEMRLRALSRGTALANHALVDACPLHTYLADDPSRFDDAARIHDVLHREASSDPGGTAHSTAWQEMTRLLC